jgi:ATP-dependent Lhr-like helicase
MNRLEEVVSQLEGFPASFSELERRILPARVADFQPSMLDQLGAMGYLVWIGHGSLGSKDGRVALYRRDRVGTLLPPPEPPDDLAPLHHQLLAHLENRGASFFAGLCSAAPDSRQDDILEALWDLVWAGLVTNDTFQPLRAIGMPKRSPRRGRVRAQPHPGAGRWSLVSELITEVSPTERAHARTVKLLERHGLVTREVNALEPVAGGFSTLYPVLSSLEEAGKVRRGYFIDGLGGAQFAFPGAVDRLRASRQSSTEAELVVLAATDPANPYGWLLPWPKTSGEGAGPRRAAGATVVLFGGRPVLYLDKGGKRILTFPAADERAALIAAGSALSEVARTRKGKYLRIETIDDQPARTSARADALVASGFFADHRGLVLEAR